MTVLAECGAACRWAGSRRPGQPSARDAYPAAALRV